MTAQGSGTLTKSPPAVFVESSDDKYSPLAIENVVFSIFVVVVVVGFTVRMDDRLILITVAYKCQTSMTHLECASTVGGTQ